MKRVRKKDDLKTYQMNESVDAACRGFDLFFSQMEKILKHKKKFNIDTFDQDWEEVKNKE